ncbi:hypothetical protein [Capsulimonas corticalis]|nr:hypothetical protein [Capsulimonas corticalis]
MNGLIKGKSAKRHRYETADHGHLALDETLIRDDFFRPDSRINC